jgi:hypothetical protein
MALKAISGFVFNLSRKNLVWKPLEGQDLRPFANIMNDGSDTLGCHIFSQPHKPFSDSALTAFESGKEALP